MNASFLSAIPLWGYFILLGLAFLTAHFLAYRPTPDLTPRRRTVGRWGSSLLFLAGLLTVSNEAVATILPALALSALGGVVSGRTAPVPRPAAGRAGSGGAGAPATEVDGRALAARDEPADADLDATDADRDRHESSRTDEPREG